MSLPIKSRRACSVFLVASTVLFLVSSAVQAQIDSEPTNNTQLIADPLLLAGLTPEAVVNIAQLGSSGTDVDFFSVQALTGQVVFGVVTPIAGLPNDFDTPDTMLATFDSLGSPLTFNDDSDADTNLPSPADESLGSLFRLEAPGTDVYGIGVTGFDDEDFDGFDDFGGNVDPHGNVGAYAITVGRVDPMTLGGDFADTDPLNDTRSGADPIAVSTGTAAIAVNELTASGTDVDFFEVRLQAGQIFTAMTAPLDGLSANFDSPDTLMGIFDSSGTKLFDDDDAGNTNEADDNPAMFDLDSDNPSDDDVFGSALHFFVPADGIYYLGVTGFDDEDFDGLEDGTTNPHGFTGNYALMVSVAVPEPSALVLLGLGSLLVLPRVRR